MLDGGVGDAFTAMLTVPGALPAEFVAVTVYPVMFDWAVGVPLMTPEFGLMLRPAGRFGAAQLVTALPLAVGAGVLAGVPTVNV